jgi:precorrin-6A/cobalt-precorrin-6A reductase
VAGRILILGRTDEAAQLADVLGRRPEFDVLASGPDGEAPLPVSRLRVGRFWGIEELVGWIRDHDVSAIVDASPPFVTTSTEQAAVAAALTGTAVLRLVPPAWEPGPGDRWHLVEDMLDAARAARLLGDRIFLTIGRREVEVFAEEREWFLIRARDLPEHLPARHEVILARGPFVFDDELALMRQHDIEVLVTKNVGGTDVDARLVAARALGIPVVMVDRPALPSSMHAVSDVDNAMLWIKEHVATGLRP